MMNKINPSVKTLGAVVFYLLAVVLLQLLLPPESLFKKWAFTVLSYFILVMLLDLFLFKKIQAILKEREKRIKDAMSIAEIKEKEALELQARLSQEQKHWQEKMQQATEENYRQCQRTRDDLIRKAKEEIQEMRLAAKADIERERRLAWEEFRQKILSLSILLAQRALRENLTDEDHERYNQTLMDMLEEENVGDKI